MSVHFGNELQIMFSITKMFHYCIPLSLLASAFKELFYVLAKGISLYVFTNFKPTVHWYSWKKYICCKFICC